MQKCVDNVSACTFMKIGEERKIMNGWFQTRKAKKKKNISLICFSVFALSVPAGESVEALL